MSRPKYSTTVGKLPAHNDSEVNGATISGHAAERWDHRTPCWSMAPERAYELSERCIDKMKSWTHSSTSTSPVPTEVRYVLEWKWDGVQNEVEIYEALFIQRNDVVVTIYPRSFVKNSDAEDYMDELKGRWLESAP